MAKTKEDERPAAGMLAEVKRVMENAEYKEPQEGPGSGGSRYSRYK